MTTASSFRNALRMLIGALIGVAGAALAVLGGFTATFPLNLACAVIGVLIGTGGAKLFHKGCNGH